MASNSNIEILQRFQNKILRIIVDVLWYVTNNILHHDFNVPYIRNKIKRYNRRYTDRMKEHPNEHTHEKPHEKHQDSTHTKKKTSTRPIHLTGAIL